MRSGVFYEAGFAAGLDVPVIFTCSNQASDKAKEHFDTRQINHIFWNDVPDLRKQLKERIAGTIPNTPIIPDQKSYDALEANL